MRKTSLILLGAAAGAALTLISTQPRIVFDGASAQGGRRRHLSAAQPVRRRVRAGARRLRREARRRQAGRIGDQRHADRARSAFELHGRQELPRHAGADPRRVRRPRHRGHDGRRPDQGRGADRRDARRQGRHHGQRHHHPSRRRAGAGPHPQPGGREDARPGQHQDQAQDHAQGRRTSRSRSSITRDIIRVRSVRSRLEGDDVGYHPRHPVQRADHRGPEEGDRRPVDAGPATSSRASSSTCATIRAACSIRRSRSPTRSWRRARSSRPAAATPKRPSASTPAPATSPRASR